MEKEYIKASEYAKKMALNVRTVYRYYHNGKIKVEEPYKNGKLDGTAKAYDENGKVIQQATFKNGEQVK